MTCAIRALSGKDGADPGAYRYLCLPPAGGSVRALREIAGPGVWGVEYPGRGDRTGLAMPVSLAELAEQITQELLHRWGPALVSRTVLAGFSMGAFVAVEIAQRVHTWCGTAPAAVVVVGAPAPDRRVRGRYARVAEEALAGALAREGFVPGAGNRASFELWAYARDLLREDLRLVEAWRGPQRRTVPCPLAALCGAEDTDLETADATEGWRTWTAGPFFAATVPGAHLALLESGQFAGWTQLIEQDLLGTGDG